MRDPHRLLWNEQQKALQQALKRPAENPAGLACCRVQHAMGHSSRVAPSPWSFDDELWQGLGDEAARITTRGFLHSIAWMMWHIARCEDITMNLLVAGTPQVMDQAWLEKMQITRCDTGNAMDDEALAAFNHAVVIGALRAYRDAVGRRTQTIIQELDPAVLKQPVDPARIQRVKDEKAVTEDAGYLTDYWGSRTIAGLLLMPATRHLMVHLNESLRLKKTIH